MTKALVVLSGGQDSTTCLYWALRQFDVVSCITFDYNQRHSREITAAIDVVSLNRLRSHEIIKLGPILAGRSPLTNEAQPLEQYSDHASMELIIGERIEHTFVPMRNALFLTIAANRAICADTYNIVTGVCQADNANYPDCRLSFIDAQGTAINEALGLDLYDLNGPCMQIHTPLMNMSKAESIKFALDMPGCYTALGYSHTAYDGGYPPTGKDHATILRAHGFEEADVPDPLVIRAYLEMRINLDHELMQGSNYTRWWPQIQQLIRTNNTNNKVIVNAGLRRLEEQVRT